MCSVGKGLDVSFQTSDSINIIRSKSDMLYSLCCFEYIICTYHDGWFKGDDDIYVSFFLLHNFLIDNGKG